MASKFVAISPAFSQMPLMVASGIAVPFSICAIHVGSIVQLPSCVFFGASDVDDP